MTVEIKDTFKVKTKRKEHPNASKYPGRPSLEFGTAVRKFLSEITAEQAEQFAESELVYEEEITAEFYDSILEGDIVGLGLFYGLNDKQQPSAHKFKILKIYPGEDKMVARDVTYEHPKRNYTGPERELTFQDISCAFGMGFGEILERDGKPFGVSEEIELTVNVYGEKDENAAEAAPSLPAPESNNVANEGNSVQATTEDGTSGV